MIFIYNGTENVEYEWINITILDGNVMNMYLVITEGNNGYIYDNDSECHG